MDSILDFSIFPNLFWEKQENLKKNLKKRKSRHCYHMVRKTTSKNNKKGLVMDWVNGNENLNFYGHKKIQIRKKTSNHIFFYIRNGQKYKQNEQHF